MSIERLEKIKEYYEEEYYPMRCHFFAKEFMGEVVSLFKHQSDQIADLRQELAKKENAISIGDVIKEARLYNG